MGIAQDTLERARAAETVSKSTNIAVKEVIARLKANQNNPENEAALTEAMAILEGMIADDNAVLVENTPEAPAE